MKNKKTSGTIATAAVQKLSGSIGPQCMCGDKCACKKGARICPCKGRSS